MSVIEATALFQTRGQYTATAETAVHVRHTKPVQIKQLIDALPHATGLFDTASRILYLNKRLIAILKHDPHSERVTASLRELGREAAMRKTEHTRQITTVAGQYRARATFLQLQLIGSGDTVIISVEPTPDALPAVDVLRLHFGLTEQEARVALYLAQRLTTDEIGEQLHITRNTVRRHIERVFAKIGVSTRTDVRERLLASHKF